MVIFTIFSQDLGHIGQFLCHDLVTHTATILAPFPRTFQQGPTMIPNLIIFGIGTPQGRSKIQVVLDDGGHVVIRDNFGETLASKMPNRVIGRVELETESRQAQRSICDREER